MHLFPQSSGKVRIPVASHTHGNFHGGRPPEGAGGEIGLLRRGVWFRIFRFEFLGRGLRVDSIHVPSRLLHSGVRCCAALLGGSRDSVITQVEKQTAPDV